MIPRWMQSVVAESLAAFPVVLLTGPRQVGKSTLARALVSSRWKARYLTLDDRPLLDAALRDPEGFVEGAGTPVIIDEIQRAPELMLAVKRMVDRRKRPGMYLLTGSAHVLTLAKVSETLAGRVAVHELLPFACAEIARRPAPDLLNRLFRASTPEEALRGRPRSVPPGRMGRIRKAILSGGFPDPALMRKDGARRTWFESYRQTYLERDLRGLANVEHLPDFNRLLTLLSIRTGRQLNLLEVSRELGLPYVTLRRYFDLAMQTYLVFLLRPYASNQAKRLVRTPVIHACDTGMACHFGGTERWDALERQGRAGQMLETWVVTELRKLLAVGRGGAGRLWYWRTRGGHEVDVLVERGEEVVGIEVKSGMNIAGRALAGLRACREGLGPRWRFGVVLYGGTDVLVLDEKTMAIPFSLFFGMD